MMKAVRPILTRIPSSFLASKNNALFQKSTFLLSKKANATDFRTFTSNSKKPVQDEDLLTSLKWIWDDVRTFSVSQFSSKICLCIVTKRKSKKKSVGNFSFCSRICSHCLLSSNFLGRFSSLLCCNRRQRRYRNCIWTTNCSTNASRINPNVWGSI